MLHCLPTSSKTRFSFTFKDITLSEVLVSFLIVMPLDSYEAAARDPPRMTTGYAGGAAKEWTVLATTKRCSNAVNANVTQRR